jgi:hypothetical protein
LHFRPDIANSDRRQNEWLCVKGDVVVKQILAAVVAVSAIAVGPAVGQICSGGASNDLSLLQIQSLVSGKYACVGSSPNAQWNELHTAAGTVLDYKLGPTSATDPSDTASHPTGQYTITDNGNSGHGTITYNYGAQSFAYSVKDNLTHPLYSFCGTGGGAPQLAVTISNGHC